MTISSNAASEPVFKAAPIVAGPRVGRPDALWLQKKLEN
jgi:hypothetical protein